MRRLLALALGLALAAPATASAMLFSGFSSSGGLPAQTLYGITLDCVGVSGDCTPQGTSGVAQNGYYSPYSTAAAISSINAMAKPISVQVVFDLAQTASHYTTPLSNLHSATNIGKILGMLWDSTDAGNTTIMNNTANLQSWVHGFTGTDQSTVDIWEVGNEVNGNWLCGGGGQTACSPYTIMDKIEDSYSQVKTDLPSAKTALIFFYEGEPSSAAACYDSSNNCPDNNNCIATSNTGNDMFNWIKTNFDLTQAPNQRPAASESVRLGVNYVLISWYPDGCPGETPNWAKTFQDLSAIFPNAYVGFGELGTGNEYCDLQSGQTSGGGADTCTGEENEINNYYPSTKFKAGAGGIPSNYVGGYFWWYGAQELVEDSASPITQPLWSYFNNAIQQ
jgi:hypothetical protein